MRRAARVDGNQGTLVAGLRKVGATVTCLHGVGRGVPDLLVGWRGRNYLFELKDPAQVPSARKLTDDEATWHSAWKGQAAVIETLDDALRVLVGGIG